MIKRREKWSLRRVIERIYGSIFFSFIDETRKLNRGGTRNIIFGPKNMTEM